MSTLLAFPLIFLALFFIVLTFERRFNIQRGSLSLVTLIIGAGVSAGLWISYIIKGQ